MEIYYTIVMFIFGTLLGSFYNVVGYRLPKGESIVFPSSHCPNCNHKLKPFELIPILSFLFLGRKCSKCKQKISWFYAIFEFLTGVLFALSYIIFKNNIYDVLIAVTLVSMLVIIIISDYHYLIIPDSVLIIGGVLLFTFMTLKSGFDYKPILNGTFAFIMMFVIKIFGDKLFKKESMGGGDIKLMFILGMVLGFENALCVIFLGSFIGLPIAFYILYRKKTHVLPFGPLLAVGALIIFFTKFDIVSYFNSLV